MDEGAEGVSPQPSSEPKPFSEQFREVFPWYMAIGMTYDQFWHGDPYLAVYYREAHELKRDEENQKMWWNGLYTYIAISTALSNIHFDGKRHKVNEYLNEPLRIREKTEAELEAEREEAKEKVKLQLDAWKMAFDLSHSEETDNAERS